MYVKMDGAWVPIQNVFSATGVRTVMVSSQVAVDDFIVLVNALYEDAIVTLPEASYATGRVYNIKRIDATANIVTIVPAGSETIDGEASLRLWNQYDNYTIVSDGVNWHII